MLRSLLAVLVVLLLGSAAAGAYWHYVALPAQQKQQAPGPGGRGGGGPVPVEAMSVKVEPAETAVEAVGTLLSNESVTVRPEVAGRIAAFHFEEGGRVTAGQLLVELDASTEKATLAEAKARLMLAQNNLERARELRRTNVGTQRALDEAEAAYKIAEAAVELAQAQFAKRQIKAPFDAKVGLRRVSVGEFVTAGTELTTLEQIDPIKVDFRVPELFLPAVAVGNPIRISVDAFPDRAFVGRVTAIDPAVDERGRALIVRAAIDNPDEALRPGLFARVQLTLSIKPEALWIAEEAIVPQGREQVVFRLVDQGEGKPKRVERVVVKTGMRRPGEVEIVEGLRAGDLVVTAGVGRVRDGAAAIVQAPGQGPRPGTGGGPPTARGAGTAPAPQG
ncbi:MAG: efflux RND transporter periplasmic adaptor subunit [Geminicoccaceae bacterium]|nr:efflux RND transporter periplasmic adaptor subunit [Geminicoccaceae bacterium]MCX8100530.1 efflux RND transporter periplasmic adaptor subunit [Geminicoccaceae bacterium]MDW8369676.1 efflux RND transporter periplasmic adaptor subunit [Geminicoccaceae bacterium]